MEKQPIQRRLPFTGEPLFIGRPAEPQKPNDVWEKYCRTRMQITIDAEVWRNTAAMSASP